MKLHLSSLTLQNFFSITNSLDKIKVIIEDEDQALLLLCSLPSSYKSFREAIIYGCKSTITINEVKEHLLNKDKIDNQLTSKSHRDDSEQAHFTKEKSNNGSFMGNLKHKNLVCNRCHKKGHIRVDCWSLKKKQQDANVTEVAERDEDKCDILYVTDSGVHKYQFQ